MHFLRSRAVTGKDPHITDPESTLSSAARKGNFAASVLYFSPPPMLSQAGMRSR